MNGWIYRREKKESHSLDYFGTSVVSSRWADYAYSTFTCLVYQSPIEYYVQGLVKKWWNVKNGFNVDIITIKKFKCSREEKMYVILALSKLNISLSFLCHLLAQYKLPS